MVVNHEPMDTDSEDAQFSDTEPARQSSEPAPTAAAPADETHSLCICFTKRPTKDAVRSLDAAIVAVRMPANRKARNCLVDFRSAADKAAALKRLAKATLNGTEVDVREPNPIDSLAEQLRRERHEAQTVLRRLVGNIEAYGKSNPLRSVTNAVFVRDLPRDVRRTEVADLFPEAIEVRIVLPKRETAKAGASVVLPSPADALRARNSKVTVRDVVHRPEFQRDGQHTLRVAKRLASRGISMGAPRYFKGPPIGEPSDADAANGSDASIDGEVDEEIMKIYN